MKRFILIIIITLLPAQNTFAAEIGKIIYARGSIEKISIATGKRFSVIRGSVIRNAQKIKTGKKSAAEIMLNDGTSVRIREKSSVCFISLRKKSIDLPTSIKIDYGKIKISQKWHFNDRTLIIKTPSAIISNVLASVSLIISETETKILVLSHKIGIASSIPNLKKAYIAYRGQEISIRTNNPPSAPLYVKPKAIPGWFGYYSISKNKRFIYSKYKDDGIIDWLLRKRKL